jgi:putative ABC transport system substrate-binding protein
VRRRDLGNLLAGTAISAASAPFAAGGEPKTIRVIGWLSGVSPESYAPFVAAFRSGLAETGYDEGANLGIEYRWAEDRPERLPELAEDLVQRNVEVIVAGGGSPGVAKKTTATIPIVFVTGTDPVAAGIVASLNRPGGNVTGVSFLTGELMPKRLQLLRELIPNPKTVAMLVNPNTRGGGSFIASVKEAAADMGLQLELLDARSDRDFAPAFARLVELRADALLVSTDPLFTERRDELVDLAAHHAIPASYAWREFVISGGLMSYGASIADAYRQAGIYAGESSTASDPPVSRSYSRPGSSW